MYDSFWVERNLIPARHYHEIAFEDLERDPLVQLQALYQTLDFPAFEETRPALERYLQSLKGYEKNRFSELSADLKRRIAQEWRAYFEVWGYDTRDGLS